MSDFKPLYDRVLIKRKDPETKTVGGLFVPQNAQNESNICTVVAVGDGRLGENGKITPLKVEAGMTVVIGKYAGTEVKLNGEECLIVREDELLGVML